MHSGSDVEWHRVAEGVYRGAVDPETVTITVVAGAEQTLLVDAGWNPEQGAALAASARQLTGRPVSHVVITHGHYDHWFGLGGIPDAESWGHEWLGRPGAAEQAATEMRGPIDAATVPVPRQLIRAAGAIDLGERRVEILHFAAGHHPSDVVVWVPDANVVVAGDIVEPAGYPVFGPETSLRGWLDALDGVLGLCDQDTVVICGHGDPVDRDEVAVVRHQLELVQTQAGILHRRGITLDEALADLPEAIARGSWPLPEPAMRAMLPIAFAELELQGDRSPQAERAGC